MPDFLEIRAQAGEARELIRRPLHEASRSHSARGVSGPGGAPRLQEGMRTQQHLGRPTAASRPGRHQSRLRPLGGSVGGGGARRARGAEGRRGGGAGAAGSGGGCAMDSGAEEYELNGDLHPGAPGSPGSLDAAPARWGWRTRPINVNHYANKKSAAESMLDIALLMANASQLKAVIEQGPSFAFFMPLVVLISISLVLQIGVGVLLIFLVKYDLNNPAKHAKLDFLNNLATGLVFIIVVVNIFITAFGVQKPMTDVAPRQ
ncbi:ninjurin-1 [Rhynchocyon petersi]